MILRNLTKHIEDQNWFAVLVDFLIVVVGVYIGIQVSNWNDVRLEQDKQDLVDARIRNDFALIEQNINEASTNHENLIKALYILKSAIARGEALPEEDEAIKLALNNGFQYWPVLHRSGTIIELLSSGRLDLITDEDLRIALIRFDRSTQQNRFNLEQIRSNMHPNIMKFTQYKQLGPLTRNEQGRITWSSVVSCDIDGMAVDKEFQATVNAMIEMQSWVHVNMNSLHRELDLLFETLRSETR